MYRVKFYNLNLIEKAFKEVCKIANDEMYETVKEINESKSNIVPEHELLQMSKVYSFGTISNGYAIKANRDYIGVTTNPGAIKEVIYNLSTKSGYPASEFENTETGDIYWRFDKLESTAISYDSNSQSKIDISNNLRSLAQNKYDLQTVATFIIQDIKALFKELDLEYNRDDIQMSGLGNTLVCCSLNFGGDFDTIMWFLKEVQRIQDETQDTISSYSRLFYSWLVDEFALVRGEFKLYVFC